MFTTNYYLISAKNWIWIEVENFLFGESSNQIDDWTEANAFENVYASFEW